MCNFRNKRAMDNLPEPEASRGMGGELGVVVESGILVVKKGRGCVCGRRGGVVECFDSAADCALERTKTSKEVLFTEDCGSMWCKARSNSFAISGCIDLRFSIVAAVFDLLVVADGIFVVGGIS